MSNNWITWNGGECPVPLGTLVDVRFRKGNESLKQKAGIEGHPDESWAEDWSIDKEKIHPGDIVAYRLSEPNEEMPLITTFIEIGADSSIVVVCSALRNRFDVAAITTEDDTTVLAYNMTETAANIFRNMIVGLQSAYTNMKDEDEDYRRG